MPAFNESQRIEDCLKKIPDFFQSIMPGNFEIIVVDDGSLDDTASKVSAIAAKVPEIRLISYHNNRGKGFAVRKGVLASTGKLVLFTDTDLSTPIEDYLILKEKIGEGYDIAIGSRAIKGSVLSVHQPKYREIGGKALNLFIRLLAVKGIHDTQCGFKLFVGDKARFIFSKCRLDGFSFDVEALYLARKLGYSIAETPVHWAHCEGSKVKPFKDGWQLLKDVVKLRFMKYDIK